MLHLRWCVALLQGKARERLTAALRRCPRSAAGNRSKLLKYLIPVQARSPAATLKCRRGRVKGRCGCRQLCLHVVISFQ